MLLAAKGHCAAVAAIYNPKSAISNGMIRSYREALEGGLTPKTKRGILDLLDCRVTLVLINSEKWLDVLCALTLDTERLYYKDGRGVWGFSR